MQVTRPTPFDLAFQDAVQSEFPAIHDALEKAGTDPRDRDAFLMVREVISLIRDLRPDEGLGSGIDQLAALVHHAYLFWDSGGATVELSSSELETLLQFGPSGKTVEGPHAKPLYAQLPLRRMWARVVEGDPAEPLDGCFIHLADESTLRVLAVLGMHPERPGFSVVEVIGHLPGRLQREDGTPLFSAALPGGDRAGLFSIVGGEELLELGWRIVDLAPSSQLSGS